MRDDEKMFNIGIIMFVGIVCLVVFLQVCYRVQNNNLKNVRLAMQTNRQTFAVEETKFSGLVMGDSLRGSLDEIFSAKKPETVSFSKTINIDDIPMVQE